MPVVVASPRPTSTAARASVSHAGTRPAPNETSIRTGIGRTKAAATAKRARIKNPMAASSPYRPYACPKSRPPAASRIVIVPSENGASRRSSVTVTPESVSAQQTEPKAPRF